MPLNRRFPTPARLAAIAAASGCLILTAAAGAQPIGNGGGTGPSNAPPHASFQMSPSPALVTQLPVAEASTAAPVARAVVSCAVCTVLHGFGGDEVTFDASASSDSDGIARYEWDLDGDGTFETSGATAAVETRRFYRTGTFRIALRVTDTLGATSQTSQLLVVHRAPSAGSIVTSTSVGYVGQQFKISPSGASGDPYLSAYVWTFDDPGTPMIKTSLGGPVPARFTVPGVHHVKLTVEDSLGALASTTRDFTIENRPHPDFTIPPATTSVFMPVRFDASASTADSPIVDYKWDLNGDGTFETDMGTDPAASTRFLTGGTHTVSLAVTDALGVTAVAQHDVTVISVVEPVPTHGGMF